uniref:uncharacterized protein K02A2.6-like n=1 Tax=Anopheles coluzzii TaxID=1518534 RepID=UPI0020FFEA1C|nr:uncharacterized protein K02A2.6-like [Anopheles coluzzii]XP_049462479.1 uncharacterized protein K02A2.6-like [Anopheles coluzzii]
MPAPKQLSEVRSFLGAINFYGRFVPQMRNLRYPLDELLKKEGAFQWTPECQNAFQMFKRILKSDRLLTHYDPSKEIIVAADASSVGVGATISHRMEDGTLKVIQHTARALTKAEMNYIQPDREGLAVIFAVTKFHRMIYGRRFMLQTDHAPLLRIFGARTGIPIYTANKLQRWALTLLLYDFKIEYVPTDKFGNADILSRLIEEHEHPEEDYVIASIELDNDMNAIIDNVTKAMPLTYSDVREATKRDPTLTKVSKYIQEGWPQRKSNDIILRSFQARSEALSTLRECILFGERLVVPEALRRKCLRQLHLGHPGIQRMKSLTRSYVYWPGLDSEIAELVKSCPQCAAAAKSPPHSTPIAWPTTSAPWQRVHVDYAGPIDGFYYLLAIDSFSKWPKIVQTTKITTQATIRILRGLFARLGGEFCTTNGIEHIRTAPYHPQSNGQAERFVDSLKRGLKKISEGGASAQESLDIFLLMYRSLPNRQLENGKSPAELMLGRRMRTVSDIKIEPWCFQRTMHPLGQVYV